MLWTLATPGSSSLLYSFLVEALYQSRKRPTKGEMRKALASAAAMACGSENISVRLQLTPWSRCRISAALMPSHVEAILIRMRSLEMPSSLYSYITNRLHVSSQSTHEGKKKKRYVAGGGLGSRPTSMMCSALSIEALMLLVLWLSTSVDTLPGMMARISLPNSTRSRSRAASTWSSTDPPFFLAYSMATSISLAYSGLLAACRIREGLVVASWGLYLPMAGGNRQHPSLRIPIEKIIWWCFYSFECTAGREENGERGRGLTRKVAYQDISGFPRRRILSGEGSPVSLTTTRDRHIQH